MTSSRASRTSSSVSTAVSFSDMGPWYPGRTARRDGRLVSRSQMGDERQIVRRSIGIAFSDGGLLALSAVRPQRAQGHGEEEVAAVLCSADGAPIEVSETLLSTEYGADGVQRR